MKKINIAIDGPSAAGKSTVADQLANNFNYIHLDTGSMYRAVAYIADKYNIPLADEAGIVALLEKKPMEVANDGTISIDSYHLKKELYGDTISMMASDVSKNLLVRQAMVTKQRQIASKKGYIVDGRDIGTVVLPDAEVKIFLTATPEDRAIRRLKQNKAKGINSDYETILNEIKKRDYQDTHRANSPLKQAADATLIDTSRLSIGQVIETISKIVIERTKND